MECTVCRRRSALSQSRALPPPLGAAEKAAAALGQGGGLGMGALCIAKGSYVSAGGEEMSVWYHKRQVDICVSGMRYAWGMVVWGG